MSATKWNRYCVVMAAWMLLLGLGLLSGVAQAAPKNSKKSPLADFYKAVGSENYAEAKRLADRLLPQSPPKQKLNISLAYGRVLLGMGEVEPAQRYLALMGKQKLPGDAPQLLSVYKAWLTALDGKQDAAIKTLQKIVEQENHTIATLEAADVLAMLYMAKGDQKSAKRTVDFGLKFIDYAMLKPNYTKQLLRGRLRSRITWPEAEKLYVEAEKLRKQDKFAKAGRLFNQVTQKYAGSEWVHPAQFRAGQCLLGLGRSKQAFDHWTKFIEASPAGPWRGQAHVARIDRLLETGDLHAASEQSLSTTTLLEQSLEEEAQKSWQDAAYDIRLRHGILALIDSRFDVATTALQQAREAAPKNQRLISGLDRLIQTAEKRTPLLPEEVRMGDAHMKMVAALSLGTVYNRLQQFEVSRKQFLIPLASRGRGSSPPHRSFAALGLARVTASMAPSTKTNKKKSGRNSSPPTFGQAKSLYQQSLKEYARGSWHDETLRDLALLVERMAADEFIPKPKAVAAKNKAAAKPPAKPTDEQRRKQAEQLTGARAEALSSWTALSKQFPNSRHVPQALYHAGLLFVEGEKPADALRVFTQLVKRYPDSLWTGDAQVWLIDVKLEQQFDLPGAAALATAAIAWCEKLDPVAAARARRGFGKDESQGLRTLKQVGHDIYLRAGLVAYLQGHPDQATAHFAKAKPLAPPRGFVVVQGKIPTGLEKLTALAKQGKMITPEEVRAGDEKAKLILMLADVYYEAEQYEKSIELCEKLILNTKSKTSRDQRSWAYFKRGRSVHGQLLPLEAVPDFRLAAQASPEASWAPTALFYAANTVFNYERDKPDEAIAAWKFVARQYPKSPEAEIATYHIGFAFQYSGRPKKAKQAYESFLEKYPDSPYCRPIRKEHLPEVEQLQ